MDLAKLKEPFDPSDIEWRIGQAGKKGEGIWAKVLAYVTNRAIMDRLDEVCGPENWRNEFREWNIGETHGVLCGISIRLYQWEQQTGKEKQILRDEWITKWDGAENTDIESVKGGLSSSMKRAAVQWGIGRYLYDLEEGWATVSATGKHYAPPNEKKGLPAFKWDPPPLPAWATPSKAKPKTQKESGNATIPQASTIAALALELKMDVQKDIYTPMNIKDRPTKEQADAIIIRLEQKKRDLSKELDKLSDPASAFQ